eukprot:gene4935-5582_t
MTKHKCPYPGCTYETEDITEALAVVMIGAHAAGTHVAAPTVATKIEHVKRPTVSAAGTSEEWTYFQSRWDDYVEATKITGKDKVVQLLECCDDLTSSGRI